jgi:hypothetical protein
VAIAAHRSIQNPEVPDTALPILVKVNAGEVQATPVIFAWYSLATDIKSKSPVTTFDIVDSRDDAPVAPL